MSDDQKSKNIPETQLTIISKIIAFYPFLFIGALVFITYSLGLLHGSIVGMVLKFNSLVATPALEESLLTIARCMSRIAFYSGIASLLASIIACLHYRGWRGRICLGMGLVGFLAIL